MKILTVLLTESAIAAYRELDDTQSIVLMRLASGKTTGDTASPREKAVMDQLADFGLVNDLSYELTQQGAAVANLAQKYGPRDARMVQARVAKVGQTPAPFEKDRKYSSVGDAGTDMAGSDNMMAPISSPVSNDPRRFE